MVTVRNVYRYVYTWVSKKTFFFALSRDGLKEMTLQEQQAHLILRPSFVSHFLIKGIRFLGEITDS